MKCCLATRHKLKSRKSGYVLKLSYFSTDFCKIYIPVFNTLSPFSPNAPPFLIYRFETDGCLDRAVEAQTTNSMIKHQQTNKA